MNFNFGEFYNTQSSFNWLSLVSAVVAAFALYITYRAWKNYDVKKHFIKQQMDTVFELVGTLQKTVFIMDTKDNGSYRSVTIRTNRISEMMYYLSPTYSKYKGTLF